MIGNAHMGTRVNCEHKRTISAVLLHDDIFFTGHHDDLKGLKRGTNKMGHLFSKSSDIVCEDHLDLADDDFALSMDAQAFEFHMLSNLPTVRVTTLDATNGKWGHTSDRYTKEDPYEDANMRVWPFGTGDAKVHILKPTTVLVKMPRTRVKTVLCRNKNEPVVFVRIILKKKQLEPGTYVIKKDLILKNDANVLVIVATPDTSRVTTLQALADKNYDPNLTLFMAASLPSPEIHE